MSIYKITSTGQRIIADQAFCDQYHPGDWEYVGEQVQNASGSPRGIRDWEFRNRFTQAQLVGIMRAAMTGDDVAALVWLRLSTASDGVDLDDPDSVAGVQYVATTYPALGIDPAVILA
jgi:hypothetical protein